MRKRTNKRVVPAPLEVPAELIAVPDPTDPTFPYLGLSLEGVIEEHGENGKARVAIYKFSHFEIIEEPPAPAVTRTRTV